MDDVLRIEGPFLICQAVCCTADVDFKVSVFFFKNKNRIEIFNEMCSVIFIYLFSVIVV